MSQRGDGAAGGEEKTEWSGRRAESKALRKVKNSGNEAKESLKTKEDC